MRVPFDFWNITVYEIPLVIWTSCIMLIFLLPYLTKVRPAILHIFSNAKCCCLFRDGFLPKRWKAIIRTNDERKYEQPGVKELSVVYMLYPIFKMSYINDFF